MKLRTIALAVALAVGATGVAEAKQHHPKSRFKGKKYKVKKFKYKAKYR